MKIPSILRTLIYKCDLFSTQVNFRYKEQPQYATLTGGLLSFLLILSFIGIFLNTGLNMLNKEIITASEYRKVFESPQYLNVSVENKFYFTMGLTGIKLNSDSKRYFDFVMEYRSYENGTKIKTKIDPIKCERSVWESFNDQQLLNSYDNLGLEEWICPPVDKYFEFEGKFTSDVFKFIKVSVQKCTPSLTDLRPCASDLEIQNLLTSYQEFVLNVYFINTIINPNEKEFKRYYLEDKNYFPFTLTQGMSANLYISSYNIETDQSLLPVEQTQQETGGMIVQTAQLFPYSITGEEYVKIYFRKSNQQIFYKRSFQKIDQTLSYIGGLFSSLLTFLMIVCLYNELSYELEIAKNIYKYDKQTLLDTNGFHFFNYLGYLVYSFLKFFRCETFWKWEKMEQYDQSLNQVRKQMDIRLIFKKIFFTEQLADVLLSKEQLTALHLEDKITMQQAEKIRQDYFLPKLLVQELEGLDNVDHSQSQSSSSSFSKRFQMTGRDNIMEKINEPTKKTTNLWRKKNTRIHFKQSPNSELDDESVSNESQLSISKALPVRNKSTTGNAECKEKAQISASYLTRNRLQFQKRAKTQKQMITNSVNSISLCENKQVFMKLVNILVRLEAQQSEGDQISRKILSKVSSEVKGILMGKDQIPNEVSQNPNQSHFQVRNDVGTSIQFSQAFKDAKGLCSNHKKINTRRGVFAKQPTNLNLQPQSVRFDSHNQKCKSIKDILFDCKGQIIDVQSFLDQKEDEEEKYHKAVNNW